ncbi:MAG: wd40-like beta propeller containing protein [Bacteroidetes bacterium]|nr:MAG: wd40-like beta propeller containing protein [Bacteroidota bacterium]
MKKILYPIALMLMLSAVSCKNEKVEIKDEPVVIGPKELKMSSDRLTAELLWSMGRLGEVAVSPDQQTLLFSITYYDLEENKGNSELYTMQHDGSDFKRITFTAGGEYNPRWRPDGKKIAYMSAESGSMQLWEMNPDGTEKVQISTVDQGIGGFAYSPDQKKILYLSEVEKKSLVKELHPDLPKTTGRLNNDLMYRHWDHWVDAFSHIFVAEYDGKQLSNSKDIMEGEEWESPVGPFGGMEQITWSPDSKSIVYTSRKKKGKDYSLSTNSDLYQYNLESKTTLNLTNGMMGYDMNPVFSPDGRFIVWESMERDGYEADKIRLYLIDVQTGEKQYLTESFDQNVQSLAWSNDGSKIYFVSNWHALDQVYSYGLETKEIKKITEGVHSYNSVMVAGNSLVGTRMSMSSPVELVAIDESTGVQNQITSINSEMLNKLALGKVEERWVPTTDGKQMLVWVIYPPHFDPAKKYPALLYCQGGPQSTVSQFWSFRWNFQMMAANDYIIVAPNRRGLPGFGQEWLEQISGDYGGQNMKDYFSAIDAVSKEPYVDAEKLGAVGASYGGFSVYWMAGNHNKRFKAFIAHNGMFNLEQQYLETEEMWFANWDLGGPFWDKNNKVAQWSYANSPHKFVQNWDTPLLVIHSELDYRIVASQGMAAYNAAILKGVPAEYLYFPNENHWVLKPQNGVLWQRTFFHWLDRWLK